MHEVALDQIGPVLPVPQELRCSLGQLQPFPDWGEPGHHQRQGGVGYLDEKMDESPAP
jgi:hypothetical protein